MQCNKRTVTLFELVRLVEKGDFSIEREEELDSGLDWAFVVENKLPLQPIYMMNRHIVIGGGIIKGLKAFMEQQEGAYLRRVQDFKLSLYEMKEYQEKDVENILYHLTHIC